MSILLPYFEKSAFDTLLNNVTANVSNYAEKKDWLKDYFAEERYIAESTLEVPEVHLELAKKKMSTEELNEQDYMNAVLIHSNYGRVITPQIATNKYMWTALTHTVFKEYVQNRWGNADIKERYFCSGGRQSLNYYNAISRLWWVGELTYDDKEKYRYTKVLFEFGQQTFKDLTDCAYSMNRKITHAVIRAIAELKEGDPIVNFGDCFRDLNKYLNRRGAVASLDFLSEDEIKDLALKYMLAWQTRNKKQR